MGKMKRNAELSVLFQDLRPICCDPLVDGILETVKGMALAHRDVFNLDEAELLLLEDKLRTYIGRHISTSAGKLFAERNGKKEKDFNIDTKGT